LITKTDIPLEERISQLLQHLSIEKAHFAARIPRDWQAVLAAYPKSVSSLTLLCPRRVEARSLVALASRLLVVTGDQGHDAHTLLSSLEDLPDATVVNLQDYLAGNATDVAADRRDDISNAMLDFLAGIDREQNVQRVSLPGGEGQVAGLLYRIQGAGPPLVLLPLQYSPSQWEPLLDRLSHHYSTITLSGANVGAVFNLETRARGGYLEVVQKVVEESRLQPGEKVLDVGCGPGSLDRWLAHHTGKANPITGVDPSTYLLREAAAPVKSEGLESVVQFQEASGDSLPFPDNSFDVTMSFTAMQYVDADRMLREMMRVTRPGGRVAVLARGDDRPNLVNVPLQAELKAKVEGERTERYNELGCNDASLYRRFHQAGLSKVKMFPQLAIFTPSTDSARLQDMQDRFLSVLSSGEAEEFHNALARAQEDGSYFVAEWFHCAVGTVPE
jgi:ubiquinone/menaquinone biosynthesis C-methylase UbiE